MSSERWNTNWFRLAKQCPLTGAVTVFAMVLSIAAWLDVDIDWLKLSFAEPLEQPLQWFTSTLLHDHAVHLVFNCWWLMMPGTWIEQRYGWLRTLASMLLWSASASLAELAIGAGGVGLSGVVFGQWAFVSVLRRSGSAHEAPIGNDEDLLFVAWFLLCIFTTATDLMPIGNVAHGVGAVLGATCALACSGRRTLGWIATSAVCAIIAVGAFALRTSINLSGDFTRYLAWRANEATEQNDDPRALSLWQAAVARDRDNVDYQLAHAETLRRLGHTDLAAAAYRRVLQLDPANEAAQRRLRELAR